MTGVACRQPCLVFAGLALDRPEYLTLWRKAGGGSYSRRGVAQLSVRQPSSGSSKLTRGIPVLASKMPFIMGKHASGLRTLFFIQQLIDLAKGAQLDSDHLRESVAWLFTRISDRPRSCRSGSPRRIASRLLIILVREQE